MIGRLVMALALIGLAGCEGPARTRSVPISKDRADRADVDSAPLVRPPKAIATH